jgi:hypothetical protein
VAVLVPYILSQTSAAQALYGESPYLSLQPNQVNNSASVRGQFQTVLPIEETIQAFKEVLHAANFSVLQVGQRRILGCKRGTTTSFVELTLEMANSQSTDVICLLHN